MRMKSKNRPTRPTRPPTPKKQAFLEAYATCCRVDKAAEIAGMNRSNHYDWLESDPEYRKSFAAVKERAIESLEDEAVRRAHEGVERPVTVAGEKVMVREYSDTLLIFLLKAARPEKYRERSEVAIPGLVDLVDRIAAGRRRAAAVT